MAKPANLNALMVLLMACLGLGSIARGAETPGSTLGLPSRRTPYDLGDGFKVPGGGVWKLYRVLGALVVFSHEKETRAALIASLTAPGALLEHYSPEVPTDDTLIYFNADDATTQAQIDDPQSLETVVREARLQPGVAMANFVFVDSTGQMREVTTDGIIIQLQENVDAQNYFGTDWPRVCGLPATSDIFVLALEDWSTESVLAECSRQNTQPEVKIASPNFRAEALGLGGGGDLLGGGTTTTGSPPPALPLAFESQPRLGALTEEDKTSLGADTLALYFASVPMQVYEIQSSDRLDGKWVAMFTTTTYTTQKRVTLPKPVGSKFYRIQVVTPAPASLASRWLEVVVMEGVVGAFKGTLQLSADTFKLSGGQAGSGRYNYTPGPGPTATLFLDYSDFPGATDTMNLVFGSDGISGTFTGSQTDLGQPSTGRFYGTFKLRL